MCFHPRRGRLAAYAHHASSTRASHLGGGVPSTASEGGARRPSMDRMGVDLAWDREVRTGPWTAAAHILSSRTSLLSPHISLPHGAAMLRPYLEGAPTAGAK